MVSFGHRLPRAKAVAIMCWCVLFLSFARRAQAFATGHENIILPSFHPFHLIRPIHPFHPSNSFTPTRMRTSSITRCQYSQCNHSSQLIKNSVRGQSRINNIRSTSGIFTSRLVLSAATAPNAPTASSDSPNITNSPNSSIAENEKIIQEKEMNASELQAFELRQLREDLEGIGKRGLGGIDIDSTSQEERLDTFRRLRRTVLARRRLAVNEQEDEARERQDYYFLIVALTPCILAFLSWEQISLHLAQFIETYGAIGKNVDGNQFANNLLRPTITGIVVPVTSIALATLVSTTINVLRQRQVDIRALVNKEACELRLLRRAVFGMFGTRQHAGRRARALTLLTAYADQLNRECHSGAITDLEDLELSGGISTNELDRLSAMLHGVDGAAVSRQGSVGIADDIICRLNGYRSERVALLLTDFPDLHWIVLSALSISICGMFLLESNQAVNQYLNSIQLRTLFALLVGVFSATATLCLDLADPFTGSFRIVSASAQIGDLRLCLQEDVREATAEAGEISSSARSFLRSVFGGPVEVRKGGLGRNGQASVVGYDKSLITAGMSPDEEEDDDESNMEDAFFDSNIEEGSGGGKFWSSTSSRYGMLSTAYFHLLTGPLGSNVRALSDLAAWVASIVIRQSQNFLSWSYWPWNRRNRTTKNA